MSDKSNEKNSSVKPLAALWDALCSKYILLSLAAVIIALAAVLAGYDNDRMLCETLAAFLLLAGTAVVQSFRMRDLGLSRKRLLRRRKNLEPRLMGSIEDISGIGSTLSVLAGIAAAFSECFIIDGGYFSLDSFALPVLTAAAGALSKGVSLAFLTSQTNTLRLLFILSDISGGEKGAIKTAGRAAHYPELMKKFGRACAVRLTASLSLCAAIIVCSFGGAGAPYTCMGTAALTVLTLIMTGIFPKFDKGDYTNEKLSVWTKSLRSFVTFNAVAFALITFMFMFTFPIRSVYTEYTVIHDFDYDADISENVDIISAPERNAENASLFAGFWAVSSMLLIICTAMANSDAADGTAVTENPKPYIIGTVSALGYVILAGVFYPSSAIDAVMWLVAISFGSLILVINLIGKIVLKRREMKEAIRYESIDI